MAHTAAFPQSDSSSAEIPSHHKCNIEKGSQHRGDSLTLLKKCCKFFKVPRIGLVEVGRLGQQLNIPTQ